MIKKNDVKNMIKKNDGNLTDKEVAKLIGKASREDFDIQLFIEALVLPKSCNSCDDKELEKYIIDFIRNNNAT